MSWLLQAADVMFFNAPKRENFWWHLLELSDCKISPPGNKFKYGCVVCSYRCRGTGGATFKFKVLYIFSPSFRSGCALSNPEELIIGTDFYPEHMTYRDQPGFFFCWIPSEKAIKKVKCFVNRTEHESVFISAGEMTLRLLTAAGYSWPIVVLFWPSPYISRTEIKFRAVTHLIIWSSDPITADKRAICLKHKKDLKKNMIHVW